MKTHWKGMLSFGLVNIPVGLYSATRKDNITFNQLRKSDFSRISYKKVASDGQEVPAHEIVKGYKLSADNYVLIEERELEEIAPKSSRIIELEEFVQASDIDPRHYDTSYYLAPQAGMGKAYALLLEAMRQSGVVGIAKFVLRTREYLAAIRPTGNAMMLSTMLFANEIIDAAELEAYLPGEVNLADKEIKMAKQLIDSLVTEFKPSKYENQYQKSIMQLIEGKAESNKIVKENHNNTNHMANLMAALEASLSEIKKQPTEKKSKKRMKPTA